MDEARRKQSGEEITGEDLWYLAAVNQDDYECPDCQLPVIPCSFKKDVNLLRPYFKVHKGTNHADGCRFADGVEALRTRAKQESIQDNNGFPLPYPSRFNYAGANNLNSAAGGQGVDGEEGSRRRRSSKVAGNTREPHQYTTESFRSIVNHYLNFPRDRNLPLTADGINGNTYDECFRLLWQPTGNQTFRFQEDSKIYYARASWKTPVIDEPIVRIEFRRGLWRTVDSKPDVERPFYLEVATHTWPDLTRTAFLHEFDKALHDVRGEKNKKLYVFFIGTQDREEDYFRFFARDHRLIAIKVVSDE